MTYVWVTQIMDFSKNLTTLLGMGFKREDICGALADSVRPVQAPRQSR